MGTRALVNTILLHKVSTESAGFSHIQPAIITLTKYVQRTCCWACWFTCREDIVSKLNQEKKRRQVFVFLYGCLRLCYYVFSTICVNLAFRCCFMGAHFYGRNRKSACLCLAVPCTAHRKATLEDKPQHVMDMLSHLVARMSNCQRIYDPG